MTGLSLRGSVYYLVKRVPREYAHLETRAVVRRSLKTGDAREARRRAIRELAAMLARWEAGVASENEDPVSDINAVAALREAESIVPRSIEDIAAGPINDVINRVEQLIARDPQASKPTFAKAWLGVGVKKDAGPVSALCEQLEARAPDLLHGMSDEQKRRWRNPRKKVLRDLVGRIGDKNLLDIDRQDALAFRNVYWEQVEADEITVETANKYIHYVSGMFSKYCEILKIGASSPFESLTFKSDTSAERRRRPFSMEWIRQYLSGQDALAGLNDQARDILLVMVNTGARPSEIIGLLPSHIDLTSPIPTMRITAEGRVLKNSPSARTIPLTGLSLEAMRRNPDGFPRYRGTGGWSNLVNRYLRMNCAVTDDQSAYSLRHSFEDRLLAAGAVDRLAADLMGHATRRERYGDGASLKMKHEILQRIAI